MWCFVSLSLLVSTSAIDCLERLVSEMTCYVLSGTLNPTHSLTLSMLLFIKYVSTCVCACVCETWYVHELLVVR